MGSRTSSDESYILELCDHVLGIQASRQATFDFLRGDPGTRGRGVKLRVDAYYPPLQLVIEYRERQHSEDVAFFDKRDRLTISGIHRGEQRKRYDERRRQILPAHDITLLELPFDDFEHDSQKRLRRHRVHDEQVIRTKLARWLQCALPLPE